MESKENLHKSIICKEEYVMEDARAFILEKLTRAGEYAFLPSGRLEEMLDKIITLDETFMHATGVEDGEAYDDEAAQEYLFKNMEEAFPEHKMYLMRFTEDYLDYNEDYLESIGAIDWD